MLEAWSFEPPYPTNSRLNPAVHRSVDTGAWFPVEPRKRCHTGKNPNIRARGTAARVNHY
jgi:hypothetical protein